MSGLSLTRATRLLTKSPIHLRTITRRAPRRQYSSLPPPPPPPSSVPKPPSPHATFYSTLVPATIPVFLLGSAIYLGLQLWRTRLAHEKYMVEMEARIAGVEADIRALETSVTTPAPETTNVGKAASSWKLW